MEPVKNSQELDVRSPKAFKQQCKKKKEILELSIHMHKRTIINTSYNAETIDLKLITDLNGKM